MQTALKEALNEWSDSAGRHQVEKQQPTPLPEVTQMQTAAPDTQEYVSAATQRHGDGLRSIFEFISTHPDCAISDLKAAGFIEGTTASAIHRLYMAGKVTRTVHKEIRDSGHGPVLRNVYRYTTAVKQYHEQAALVPNPLTTKKKIVLRKKQPAAQPEQGIAALPTEIKPSQGIMRSVVTPQPETAPTFDKSLTTEYVMQNISLSEAVKLHAELKKMLG
jgi:hypothetical protein